MEGEGMTIQQIETPIWTKERVEKVIANGNLAWLVSYLNGCEKFQRDLGIAARKLMGYS